MRTRMWTGVVVAALLGNAGAAPAGFSVFSESECVVVLTGGVYGIQDLVDNNLFANTFPDAEGTQVTGADCGIGVGSGSADANATFGKLTANSVADEGEDPDVYPVASAYGGADCVVEDTLHLDSASLPTGTPVLLDFALNSYANYTSATVDPGASSSARAMLNAVVHGPTATTSVQLEYNNVSGVSTLEGTLEALVGYDVSLLYEIHAASSVNVTAGGGRQAGLVSQPRIHANAANPDVTATTDSGFDYGVPVPEPEAAEGDVAALAMLGLAVRRARA